MPFRHIQDFGADVVSKGRLSKSLGITKESSNVRESITYILGAAPFQYFQHSGAA